MTFTNPLQSHCLTSQRKLSLPSSLSSHLFGSTGPPSLAREKDQSLSWEGRKGRGARPSNVERKCSQVGAGLPVWEKPGF